MDSGQINSFSGFLLRKHRYLIIIPLAFGIIGPWKKKSLGWIFTSTIFYLFTIMGIATGVKNELKSLYEISTYLLFMTAMVLPLIIMNSKDFKQYYTIDITSGLWKENIISVGTMTMLGAVLIVLNG